MTESLREKKIFINEEREKKRLEIAAVDYSCTNEQRI